MKHTGRDCYPEIRRLFRETTHSMAVKCIIEMSKIDSRMAQTKAWLLRALVALLRFGNGMKSCV